jgi:predicted nicotinamide N-methyase
MVKQERSFKTQDFVVPSNSSGETITVRISEPNLTSENLGLETWAASHILASQLHHLGANINFPPCSSDVLPILELGAGTGLVGITASTIWKQPTVITDLEPLIPALDANIHLNAAGLQQANTHMEAGTLDWKHPTTLIVNHEQRPQTQAHLIFAADTIYSEEHPELLANVTLQWLKKDKEARFLIAYPLRVCYIDYIREMWERLEEGGLEAIEEGREEASQDLFNDERLVEWSVWRWKNM